MAERDQDIEYVTFKLLADAQAAQAAVEKLMDYPRTAFRNVGSGIHAKDPGQTKRWRNMVTHPDEDRQRDPQQLSYAVAMDGPTRDAVTGRTARVEGRDVSLDVEKRAKLASDWFDAR